MWLASMQGKCLQAHPVCLEDNAVGHVTSRKGLSSMGGSKLQVQNGRHSIQPGFDSLNRV